MLERVDEPGAMSTYRGFAHLPDADLPMDVRVEPAGEGSGEGRTAVTARIDGASAEGVDVATLEKAAAALVKAAARAAKDAGRPLPRRIVRWRGSA